MEVALEKFYIPSEFEQPLVDEMTKQNQTLTLSRTGQIDAVKLLYSDLTMTPAFS
jgi:hypothetical protein